MATCAHPDQIQLVDAPDEMGDSRPHRHASRHSAEAAHSVLRSVEPGEDWLWCAIDEVMFRVARPS